MIFPYLVARARWPLPSLGGDVFRARPVIPVRLAGPVGSRLVDGLLDTGSDDTVFEEALARHVGIELIGAEQRQVGMVGRRKSVLCRYAPVTLEVTDGVREICRWDAVVGFVSVRLRYCLLGYAGFLQFFDAEFRGAEREVALVVNGSFPGTRITIAPPGGRYDRPGGPVPKPR